MITVKPNITQKLEVDIVTDDGKDINDIVNYTPINEGASWSESIL